MKTGDTVGYIVIDVNNDIANDVLLTRQEARDTKKYCTENFSTQFQPYRIAKVILDK